ncbi:hypothetical protein EW026_g1751 [Hermanssonia centrifuga]|uniref:Protein kinase domain-containing protein n=1 Tax=Hermanssonia centrifuga TaxID=98765 RepID=A0A4S4KR83_9APHY|nr:hypothetical protein EW026_g1751 [Hermanssonia centrifuga]
MVRFEREKHAYAHLLHYGICEKGTVPRCYGWFDLSRADVEHICALPGIDKDLAALKTLRRTPKAIILEYFPDAVRLSVTNITLDIADVALRALHTIHSAYVMHKDIHRRNILLLPDNRVIWVDFDSSTCLSEAGSKMRRQDLLGELEEGWGLFYNFLVRVSLLNDRDEQFCLMSFLLAAGQAYRLSALAILKPVDYLHVKGKAVEGEEQSGGSKSSDELEARMERAMREAQEESDEDDILEGSDEEEMASGSGLSEEDEEDSDDDEEVEMQAGSEAESEEEDEDSASLKPPSKKQKLLQNPDYLPEHLFASAFSQNAAAASASSAKSEGKKKRAASALPKKRRRVKQTAKDIVVGLNFQISINPNIAVFSPPPSIEVKPFTPFNVELKTAKKRRTALGWSKRSVGKTSTSSDKENVDQNTVIM